MQNNLINVSFNALLGLKELDCDIFNEKGDLLYKKGQKVNSGFLLMLQHIKIFREDTDILLRNESYLSKSNFDMLISALKQKKGVFLLTENENSENPIESFLKSLKNPDNVTPLETLINYKLPETNQNQENSVNSLQIVRELTNIMKEKSGSILIIDIKDKIAGDTVYRASLVDHILFASTNANNSFKALSNLFEAGIERPIIASAPDAIFSQKFVRKICTNCKEKYKLNPEEIKKLFIWDEKMDVYFYKGGGCSECENTGYSGNLPVQELLIFDDNLRRLIANGTTIQEIKEYLQKYNFKDMRYDAMKKVLRGLTTIQEVNRVFK